MTSTPNVSDFRTATALLLSAAEADRDNRAACGPGARSVVRGRRLPRPREEAATELPGQMDLFTVGGDSA